jgi:hypothetical protein
MRRVKEISPMQSPPQTSLTSYCPCETPHPRDRAMHRIYLTGTLTLAAPAGEPNPPFDPSCLTGGPTVAATRDAVLEKSHQ